MMEDPSFRWGRAAWVCQIIKSEIGWCEIRQSECLWYEPRLSMKPHAMMVT
jgi:hypothetical protein